MRLELAAFSSKVARRVFLLFVIASAVPLAATALLGLVQVRDLLESRARDGLEVSARGFGQLILERLLIAAEVLPEVASGDASGNATFDAVASLDGTAADSRFGDLDLSNLPALSDERPALLVDPHRVLLVEPGAGGTLLVGRVSNEYLWGVADLLGYATDLCVFKGHEATAVFCANPVSASEEATMHARAAAGASGAFAWDGANGAMLSGYWELFTPSRLQGESLKFVVTQPRAVALESLVAFNRVVPLVLLASVATVLLLSISQIRRSMRPLEQLLSWTQQVSNRRFAARLALDTGDEFQDLAAAMNRMADRLGQQFDALTMLAEVDRLILGSEGIERVVETILQRIASIVPRARLGVLLIDADAPEKGSLYSYEGASRPRAELERVDVPPALQQPFIADGVKGQVSALLGRSGADADEGVWAVPIAHGERYFGALLLVQYDAGAELVGEASLGETADRIAVAISAKERERELVRQAHYDSLTGLPNRQLCYDRLRQALAQARRDGTRLALLFIDLDGFKNVNDSLGHAAGDIVLREAAERLARCVRDTDTVARLGGDEYVVVLPSIDMMVLDPTLERIMQALGEPFWFEDRELPLTASIGITLFPDDGETAPELLRRADTAMYSAKDAGRNRYVYFAGAMDQSAHERLSLASDLRRALNRNEFSIVYQPQIDLVSREVVCAEALLRWHHPGRGYVPPDQFVPVLEQLGIMGRVGAYVLDEAARQLAEWRASGMRLERVAVNASVVQLLESDFTARVAGVLRKHELEGSALELELTERGFVEDFERSNAVLESLRRLGVQVSIDDFGTGYSSFAYMKDLVFDAVKVDKSFVTDIPSERAVSIVRSISAVANTLDKVIVAEGIETREQLAALRRLGCDLGQGYLIAKPLAPVDFEAWLRARGACDSAPAVFDLPPEERREDAGESRRLGALDLRSGSGG